MMKIEIEPTPELYDALIDGVSVPLRVWKGATHHGVAIEAYVYSIVPVSEADAEKLRAALPEFMVRTRQMYPGSEHD